MKKLLSILLVLVLLFSLAACGGGESEKPADLSKLMTSHKWHWESGSLSDYLSSTDSFECYYDWTLSVQEDGTWSMEMLSRLKEDGKDNKSSHTLKGTWSLKDKELTVVMKDEEVSEFNETDIFDYAEDVDDSSVGKLSEMDAGLLENIDFMSMGESPHLYWYVSEKYFFVARTLFTAE